MTLWKVAYLVLFIAAAPLQVRAADADVNAYIAKAPITGVPSTAYSAWTGEQKTTAFKRVVSFCQFLCVDPRANNYASQQSAELATAEAKTCLGACVVNHLPPDFPQYAALQAQLKTDFARAKQLGSAIAWPLPGR